SAARGSLEPSPALPCRNTAAAQPFRARARADSAQSGSCRQRAAALGWAGRPLGMTTARAVSQPGHGNPTAPSSAHSGDETDPVAGGSDSWGHDATAIAAAIPPVRKAAIVLVSLDQSLASQVLTHLDRPAVEAVTWEIARLEQIDPAERAAV